MNAALFNHRHQTLYPVGQNDQEAINAMKLGKAPLRSYARRQTNERPIPRFSTVWTAPAIVFATAS